MRRALAAAVLLAPLLATGRAPVPHVVLINGGQKAKSNYESHLVHLEGMADVLDSRGLPAPTVFSSDGDDPGRDMAVRAPLEHPLRWLIEDTGARALPRTRLVDTPWDGPRQPASAEALSAWFTEPGLSAGDTLFLYTTDHGWRDKETGDAGLWLWDEKADPAAMDGWLDALPGGVTTVMVMSHCYSGAFADTVLNEALDGSRCGFFSAPASRRAYGCYPEGRSSKTLGHGFRFIDALAESPTAAAAHERVLLTDRTPDVPLATSDLYLRRVLVASAKAEGVSLSARVDALLDGEERDPLVAQLAAGVGLPVASTMAEVDALRAEIAEAMTVVKQNDSLWEARKEELTKGNFDTFRADNEVPEEAGALIDALKGAAEEQGTWGTLEAVAEKQALADAVYWRMQVRDAVLMRIQARLIRQAGEVLVSERGRRDARKALRRLTRCEDAPLGTPTRQSPPLPEDWPAMAEDLSAGLRPSFLGVQLHTGEAPGEVVVKKVLPDRPAAAAGLLAGDVLVGGGGERFVLPGQARAWAALQAVGEPVSLQVRRGGAVLDLSLTPGDFPAPEK